MPNKNNYYGKNNNDFNRDVPPEENYYVDGNDFGRGGVNPTDFYKYSENELKHNIESFSQERQRKSNPTPEKKRKKKKGKTKLFIAFTAIALVFVIIGVSAASVINPVLNGINYREKQTNEYISESELYSTNDVINILLLGVDARATDKSEQSRSDSMMLISIDKAHGCIKMTSFLRDSWVYIPVKDKNQRLNAACQYGGYQGVVDTLEYNFKIDINGYVVTDFEMFKTMVDTVGGVEIEVTEKEAKEVTSHKGRYGNVTLEAGKHNLTGEQALAYCRIRKIDTDWKRTQRQRTVIEAILKKITSSGPVAAVNTLKSIAPYIETDLSKDEIMKIGLSAVSCVTGGFEQASCPFKDTWKYENKGGASVIGLDIEANKVKLKDFIYNQEKSKGTEESEKTK